MREFRSSLEIPPVLQQSLVLRGRVLWWGEAPETVISVERSLE